MNPKPPIFKTITFIQWLLPHSCQQFCTCIVYLCHCFDWCSCAEADLAGAETVRSCIHTVDNELTHTNMGKPDARTHIYIHARPFKTPLISWAFSSKEHNTLAAFCQAILALSERFLVNRDGKSTEIYQVRRAIILTGSPIQIHLLLIIQLCIN